MPKATSTRRVVIVAYEDAESLDMSGPAEVFATASQLFGAGAEGKQLYSVEVVAPRGEPIKTSSGLRILPDASIADSRGPIDTLMVSGGIGAFAAAADEDLVAWIAAAATRSRRISSVCSGAFPLAAAGLLAGRRATTHWTSCELLAERHADVTVEPDSIYVRDGDTWTSAGVTAGIDLALAMVEADHGRELAREVARWLVVFVQRPGGQSQFSSHITAVQADREPLRELQGWIADHLGEDLRVEALAERVHMSTRNFARAFRREVGLTPAAYVEAVRIERAKQRLEEAGEPVESVARSCGFGSAETMRRAFARRVGVPPADYRARFRREGVPS
jgi:transcriptional regulator GlxA family with amidase domain